MVTSGRKSRSDKLGETDTDQFHRKHRYWQCPVCAASKDQFEEEG